MKKIIRQLLEIHFIVIMFAGFNLLAQTNSFFDNEQIHKLNMSQIYVGGEIQNPGMVDFSGFPVRSIIVKETLLGQDGQSEFVGAYRYEGYALSDILDHFVVVKKNAEDFPPYTDLFIEIENASGKKIFISWGEIYYAGRLNNIILATGVMRIVPDKTGELWPLPVDCRLIVGHDLYTERNIDNPVKITVHTFELNIAIEKGKFPLHADQVDIYHNDQKVESFTEKPSGCRETEVHIIFYGKGRGLHDTNPFEGCNIKFPIEQISGKTTEGLKTGLVVFSADDGYRAVFTLSELINRNDQEYMVLIDNEKGSGKGKFRVVPSSDFFSDRSVKGLNAIRIYIQ